MAATNYTAFKAKHADRAVFGDTAWSSTDFSSTTSALDTTFDTNNATPLLDVVGDVDSNSPVESAPFAKDITVSGNERSTTEDNLLGADSNGTQYQEVDCSPPSLQTLEMTLVYRNNVPFSIFNDSTKCMLLSMNNNESSTTGVLNMGYNNITVLHVGGLTLNPEGNMEQKIKFSHKGGTTGSVISVTQTSPAETWSRVVGGDYAEEVRLT